MTIGAAVTMVTERCELIIAAHSDPRGTGMCNSCGETYPCWTRLAAEAAVESLEQLSRIEAPGMSVRGYPEFMKESK